VEKAFVVDQRRRVAQFGEHDACLKEFKASQKMKAGMRVIFAYWLFASQRRIKLRVGVRQDRYDETLNPLITVPGRFSNTGAPLVGGVPGFQVGGGVNYRDRTWSDTTNVNSVPAYVIGNAMIGWENASWGVALNAKNNTNERYFVAANGAGGFVGEGLSAFLAVRYRQ
jgi:hypothetical protein